MKAISKGREKIFSCESETKAPGQYEARIKGVKESRRKRTDNDLCLHTLVHSNFYCGCLSFLDCSDSRHHSSQRSHKT